jgi:hypothetical protein
VTIGAQYSSTIFVADFETNQWFAASSGLGTSNISVDAFSGDNSTVAFTLSADPGSENNTQVFVSGVYQEKDTYSVSGTTLTFSTAPPTGTSNIEVVSSAPLAIGTPSDGTVTTAKLASTTGSGAVVLATSPTLVTPALGTPSALVLTNATGLPAAQLTGTQTIPRGTLPTGSVLQVVQSSYNTQATTTSSTFSDTGLSASITPTSSTSKILVLYSLGYLLQDTNLGGVQLLRGSTVLQTSVRATGSATHASYLSNEYLDSPATTSSTTYKIQFAKNAGNAFVTCWNSEQPSTITLMEIAG